MSGRGNVRAECRGELRGLFAKSYSSPSNARLPLFFSGCGLQSHMRIFDVMDKAELRPDWPFPLRPRQSPALEGTMCSTSSDLSPPRVYQIQLLRKVRPPAFAYPSLTSRLLLRSECN
jgi:hypothetical protein